LAATLEKLANVELSELLKRRVRFFKPGDVASRVLGELDEMGYYEAVVSSGDRYGLITLRDLLDVDQPEQTKLGNYSDGIWRVLNPVSPDVLVIDIVHFLIEYNVRAVPIDRSIDRTRRLQPSPEVSSRTPAARGVGPPWEGLCPGAGISQGASWAAQPSL